MRVERLLSLQCTVNMNFISIHGIMYVALSQVQLAFVNVWSDKWQSRKFLI
jgi:hypothetical protein